MKILDFFLFVGHFHPPGSGSAIWMRIRIQQPKLMRTHVNPDPDPDPKPCFVPILYRFVISIKDPHNFDSDHDPIFNWCGSRSRFLFDANPGTTFTRCGSGAISGSAEPDPYQNVTDPQHWQQHGTDFACIPNLKVRERVGQSAKTHLEEVPGRGLHFIGESGGEHEGLPLPFLRHRRVPSQIWLSFFFFKPVR